MALEAVAGGAHEKLPALCEWLLLQDGIHGRYAVTDLQAVVLETAKGMTQRPEPSEVLVALIDSLRRAENSVLVAVFERPGPRRVLHTEDVVIGTCADFPDKLPTEVFARAATQLAVLVTDRGQGRLGAVRAASWLQTVLGAIGLAAYSKSKMLCPVAACPAIAIARYTGSLASNISLETATRFPVEQEAVSLEELFDDPESHGLIADATARAPVDLVQSRLTRGVRWLEAASSAVSAADAIIHLGVALETVTGDRSKAAVVERITKRAATFIAVGAAEEEREDVYYDQRKRAQGLYDLRSRAAHGQYENLRTQDEEDADRLELHKFVADVCLGFRQHARDRSILDEDDFDRWSQRTEIHGFLA